MNLKFLASIALLGAVALLSAVAFTPFPGSGSEADAAQLKPDPNRVEDDKGVVYHKGCMVLKAELKRSSIDKCLFGPKTGWESTVVLFGDSHAMQYAPAMIRIANAKRWRLLVLTRQGCTPAQVSTAENCEDWRNNSMRLVIKHVRPELVVVSTATSKRFKVKRGDKVLSRDASQPHLEQGMVKTLQRLRDTGARVAVIRDQALSSFKPPVCIRKHLKQPNRMCSFSPTGRRDRQGFDFDAARRVKKVRAIDPMPKLCPKQRCRVVSSGMIVYRDKYHISATYSKAIAPWLFKQLPPAEKWREGPKQSD
ncbi:MAG TPA: SGNH hydrolase domain-containing protein [Solirubrobacterales bacterium]|nr:SGNH hydrolase domain-containing protein [Solirubrobacterales bacterium]